MKIIKENLTGSKVKLTINVPPELMRGFFARVYNKLAPTVEVKGFRAGKAPRNLTISAIGENRLISEVIDLTLKETYPQSLKQENIIPVAPPKIEIKKMADLTTDEAILEYVAEIDLLPEVKIGDYKSLKLKVKKLKQEAKKDEIDQVLSHLQRQHAEFKNIDRLAKEGDRVEIDFEGKERGVILENLTSRNYPVILGSKVLIPEFEKKIEGMKKNEEKEFKIKLKDKEVEFKVKMHLVQEVILPKMDDELAKKFGKKTLEELKKAISEDIVKQKQNQEKQNQENEIVENLLKISKLEIPESLTNQEIQRMIERMKSRIAMSGMPFEKYLEQMHKTEDDLRKDFKDQAEKTVKVGLILGEIGKSEKIDLTKEDAGRKVMDKLIGFASKKG
ncbi:trigger factor [Candidatus Berkelbacteria bacterium RBG_13_40_8]|uniref:Trigger factor n=1 Tax=Candidatus Berkelbacteria bacterium RBG_13_40_8 TaxID=1797467 RepID=A0A1F5DN97_9BACT|nr:MAG: trigger factor [Candidatus Berkelbacteria bacterium RBG_13_40_8]